MARKHKKHRHEEHVDESWLIPYADLLTLLSALFIVLFASSTVDAQKLQQMSQAFNDIFEGSDGAMDYNEPIPVELKPSNTTAQAMEIEKEQEEEKAAPAEEDTLQEIKDTVDAFILKEGLVGQFETALTPEGLLITIQDSVLFDPGKSDIKTEYRKLANDVSKLLEFDPPRSVTIIGHTDNVPMSTPQIPSNWDLSVMRAVNFLKLVVENENLDPHWFSAKGHGEFSPIADNGTEEGRAKNRRVEILVEPLITEE